MIIPKDNENKWFGFDGDDECSADCRGWDGKEYRCDCGDRRVGFECLNDGGCKCNDEQMMDCPNAYAVAN